MLISFLHSSVHNQDDKLVIIKKPHTVYATDILPLDHCTIDPSPPNFKSSSNAFTIYVPAESHGKDANNMAAKGFLLIAGNEHLKMECMGAILRASGWKGRQLGGLFQRSFCF